MTHPLRPRRSGDAVLDLDENELLASGPPPGLAHLDVFEAQGVLNRGLKREAAERLALLKRSHPNISSGRA